MDAGLPIVTTPIRGALDHLVEGENALFVEPHDVKGLALAIERLLGDGELRARVAAANRERIRMFDPRVAAAEYLEVFAGVCSENGHRVTRASGRMKSAQAESSLLLCRTRSAASGCSSPTNYSASLWNRLR